MCGCDNRNNGCFVVCCFVVCHFVVYCFVVCRFVVCRFVVCRGYQGVDPVGGGDMGRVAAAATPPTIVRTHCAPYNLKGGRHKTCGHVVQFPQEVKANQVGFDHIVLSAKQHQYQFPEPGERERGDVTSEGVIIAPSTRGLQ